VALCVSGLLEPRTPLTTLLGLMDGAVGLWFDYVDGPAITYQSIVPGDALVGQRGRARTGSSRFGHGQYRIVRALHGWSLAG
jgi:hypothetical protein